MKKLFSVLVIFIAMLLFVACTTVETPVAPSDPSVADSLCVKPESDNDYTWSSFSCVNVSTIVYKVTIEVDDEIINHTEVGASGSAFVFNGFGSASYRMWQEGKGLLPVKIVSIEPAIEDIPVGTNIVLKTSDLKAMSLPTGATTVFICNLDTEVLSPVRDNQVLTTDRQTYELDNCRMLSPVFVPATP